VRPICSISRFTSAIRSGLFLIVLTPSLVSFVSRMKWGKVLSSSSSRSGVPSLPFLSQSAAPLQAAPAGRPRSGRLAGASDDQRPGDRRRLRQLAVLDRVDLERRGLDRGERVAVAAAAMADELPRRPQP